MAKSKKTSVGRRGFLKRTAAGAAAALAVKPGAALAQAPAEPARPAAPPASARQVALETSTPTPRADVYTTDRPGADFMVDVLKSLNFDYIFANPGIELPRPAGVVHQLRQEHASRSGSPAATKNRRSRWRTATSRSKASRSSAWRTARSACSTRRWRSTTRTPIACRCTSFSATSRRSPSAAATSSGRTACRTRPRWCATTRSGTTRRFRSATSPSPRCARTR